jgi:hypothetical protein
MKYVIRDQHKDITSPHTNKKYLSSVSPWFYFTTDKQIVNTYFTILDDQHKFPEGEVLFVQFDRDTVAYNDCCD